MAIFKDGIAISSGVVSIVRLASGVLVPSTAVPIKGTALPGGKYVDSSGALYVRFV